MHLADGTNSNHDISKQANMDIEIINKAILIFLEKGMIQPLD